MLIYQFAYDKKIGGILLKKYFANRPQFIGIDILLDHIKEDMAELASMPIGTHIGQLEVSLLNSSLPEQFLMQYNYEFLYRMKITLLEMRMCAKSDLPMTAHSVMEELLLYLCYEEPSVLIELSVGIREIEDSDTANSEEWMFDLFGDMDIISSLYSNVHLVRITRIIFHTGRPTVLYRLILCPRINRSRERTH